MERLLFIVEGTMIINGIALLIFLSCLFAAFSLVRKKLSLLSSLDVESLPIERERIMKQKIIEGRISRNFKNAKNLSMLFVEPLRYVIAHAQRPLAELYRWIVDIREKYHKQNVVGGAGISFDNLPVEEKITYLLNQIETCIAAGELTDAEEHSIEVLALDKKSVDAYRCLARVYAYQKEWSQAKEVLLCAGKIYREKQKYGEGNEQWAVEYAELLHNLADMYKELNEPQKAWKCIKEAVELQQNNPKFLDALIDIHVVLGQRLKAEDALDKLRKVNPDNEKLDEIEGRIKVLSY